MVGVSGVVLEEGDDAGGGAVEESGEVDGEVVEAGHVLGAVTGVGEVVVFVERDIADPVRDSMRQCPWIQVVISLVARVMGTEQMRWTTSVCMRFALVRVRRSWRTCAAGGYGVLTVMTLSGSADESSIRGSGFHGMDDLDLPVVPEQDDDLQETPCCVQPDP